MQYDPYHRICSSVQARRRYVEGIDSALAGATGVRATLFAHQLAAVRRVLTDTHIRHLLADEVGLGKTVEALMIINAFRLLHPKSLIAIVAPDLKRHEWLIEEVWYRGHSLPEGFLHEQRDIDPTQTRLWPPNADAPVKEHGELFVLWPGLRFGFDNTEVAVLPRVLDRFHLVIVDELPILPQEIRDYLVRYAARIPNLILLTATPRLQDTDRRLEMLSLLEPEQLRALFHRICAECNAAATPFHEFRSWSNDVRERVLAAIDASWAHLTRRIIRSSRSDLRGFALPARAVSLYGVEPTERERERWGTISEVCARLPASVNRAQFYRRAVIGGQTLADRVGELLRERSDLPPEFLDLQHQLDGTTATDSRVDALSTVLLEIWKLEPREKVLVCCHDAPTVDYLKRRLNTRMPVVGSISDPVELRIASAGTPAEVTAALESFKNGDAQILLAANIAHLGLNLQVARVLIFYSTPWTVEEIDQWIGRLDRITNSAFRRPGGDEETLTRDLQVYVFAHREQVDETIALLFEQNGVYGEVNDLEDFALVRWIDASVMHVAVGAPAAGPRPPRTGVNSMPRFSRSDYTEALDVVNLNAPQSPAFVDEGRGPGFKRRAIAAEQWLQLLNLSIPREYDYQVRVPDDLTGREFRTLWYRPLDKMADPVTLRCLGEPYAYVPRRVNAFETRRPALSPSPRLVVHHKMNGDVVVKHLQFFDHGGVLHDEFVSAWCGLPNTAWSGNTMCVKVQCPPEHPASQNPGKGDYFVTVGWMDAAADLLPFDEASASSSNDCWWLRDQLGAKLLVFGEKLLPSGQREQMTREAVINVLTPFYQVENARGVQRKLMVTFRTPNGHVSAKLLPVEGVFGGKLAEHQARATSSWRSEILSGWQAQQEKFEEAAEQRRTRIAEEIECCEELLVRLTNRGAARGEADSLGGRIQALKNRLTVLSLSLYNRCTSPRCVSLHLTFWLKLI